MRALGRLKPSARQEAVQDTHAMSLEAVGLALGVSSEAVRRIEQKALAKLKRECRRRNITSDVLDVLMQTPVEDDFSMPYK